MDAAKTRLKFRSHNLNGFKNSKEFLIQECNDDSFSVLAIQEHWLKPTHRKHMGTNSLKVLHPKFDAYATSGMASQIDQRILKGRPYGGTGFLFHKSLSKCIRAKVNEKHDRVSVMELSTVTENILLISAYMPYYNTDNNPEQLLEYRSTLAFIENLMANNPLHKFILFMDLNCNLYNTTHPYSSLINTMIGTYDLISSFDFLPGFDSTRDYTRFDVKRNSFTLIDGILISKSISHIVESCTILHSPLNVSDHLPVEIAVNIEIGDFLEDKSRISNFIPWSSLTSDELLSFRDNMTSSLMQISIPFQALNHGSELCDNCECLIALEKFYQDIVMAVSQADHCLPRKKHGLAKPFWSPELTVLKQKSIDSYSLWKSCSCPQSGPIFEEKRKANYQYKRALRISKQDSSSSMSDEMSTNLLSKDYNSFWKNWRQNTGNGRACSSMIDGFVDHKEIADCFATVYKGIYRSSVADDKLRTSFNEAFSPYQAEHQGDSLEPHLFTWSDVVDAVFSLKLGKATSTFLKAEHIFCGSPELTCFLQLLFNGLLSHSYMPYEFLCGTITPIVKDPNGDTTDSGNYRAVTLGPIFLQVFENLLMSKFGHFMSTNDLQFGFKRSHSTSHAVFVLREVINYYTTHGSNIVVSFLDCSKAFDTISHYGIFLKLIERKVPLCFLKIMIYWYLNMQTRCFWRDAFSEYFKVLTGTKQGGVLSPRLFSMYMDGLILRLKQAGIGCHILNVFLACLLYADDMCLLAPSRGAMQQLLSICDKYCSEFCLSFNVKKSKVLLFGNMKNLIIDPLMLDNKPIEVVTEWKYLGTTISSGRNMSFSTRSELSAFYRSFNSVMSAIQKPNSLVLMNILYSNCVPNLTYAAEVKDVSSRELIDLNVALNNSIRRIFSYNRWESTRALRQQLNFPNITEIFHQRRRCFISRCQRSENLIILFLIGLPTLSL